MDKDRGKRTKRHGNAHYGWCFQLRKSSLLKVMDWEDVRRSCAGSPVCTTLNADRCLSSLT